MSKKRKNAGAGYGYMFHGAFKKKSDAVAKERKTTGAWIKGVYTPQGHRYVVMSPRTNPIKRKKKAAPAANPTELLVMGANPRNRDREITVPPGTTTTITIRTNPVNPDRYTSAHARARGITRQAPGLIQSKRQRRVAGMVREARGHSRPARSLTSDVSSALRNLGYSAAAAKRAARSASGSDFNSLFRSAQEQVRSNPDVCGAMIGGEPCTRKRGHRGPHLPQGATMRPRSRLRRGWKPNPSAAALNDSFTGREGKWITIYDEPHMPAGDYAQLGELLALYVKPNSGGQVQQITFPKGDRPLVVSDETSRQIYFVGGNQELYGEIWRGFPGVQYPVGSLGECRRIDYKQRKEHVPDPDADEWRHNFGEESEVRPVLFYDARNKRLLLEGGQYRIRTEGIIN
jgi:hypothetical protein